MFLVGVTSCSRTERGEAALDSNKWNPKVKQALFRQAMASRSVKELKEFYDRYRSDGDQAVEQVSAALQDVLYAQVKSRPVVDACDDFLDRFPDRPRSLEVEQMCEPALFERISHAATVGDCKKYLQRYRQGHRREQVRELYDAALFARTRSENQAGGYEAYLDEFPAGKHIDEVRSLLDPLLFDEVMSRDSRPELERYLRRCPWGGHRLEVFERLLWFRSRRANVGVDYPRDVWIDEKTATYSWKIVFTEQGGGVWYSVSGKRLVIDKGGRVWTGVFGPVETRSIRVASGGKEEFTDWVRTADHALCNGFLECIWTGEDAGGHPVSEKVRIHLIHSGCPGKKG
jgi:hypothetical protein